MTRTPITLDVDVEPIEQARAAFVAAVRSGANGAAEHAAWTNAHQAAVAQLSTAQTAESERFRLACETYAGLLGDRRNLVNLARYVGSQLGIGTSTAPRLYTAAEHEQRVAEWCERASEYAGREITELDAEQLVEPPPYARQVIAATPIPAAPPAYWSAVELLGKGAA